MIQISRPACGAEKKYPVYSISQKEEFGNRKQPPAETFLRQAMMENGALPFWKRRAA